MTISKTKICKESNKEFLEKCLKNKFTPSGLKFNLEPTIGNQSEKVITEWYNIQEEYIGKLNHHHQANS